MNSEAEYTQVTINLFQGLQVFFLGFNPDFVTVCILFACSALTTSVFDHKLGLPVEATAIQKASQILGWSLIKGGALSWSAGSHNTIKSIECEIQTHLGHF